MMAEIRNYVMNFGFGRPAACGRNYTMNFGFGRYRLTFCEPQKVSLRRNSLADFS
jgi:hypothetical protein